MCVGSVQAVDLGASYLKPYDAHKELAWRIKVALKPIPHQIEGRIEIPFDFLLFKGGLGNVGKPLGIHFGHERFGIKRYLDLVPLLREQWHIYKETKCCWGLLLL